MAESDWVDDQPGNDDWVDDGPEEMGILDTLDSYTGAPVRAGIGAVQDGQNPFSAAWSQLGTDPSKAPTGKQIAQKMGVSDRPIYDTSDEQFDELMTTDPLAARDLQGLRGVTRSGAAGLAVDVAADPLNFIPVGMIAKGGSRLAGVADDIAKATGRGLKSVAETQGFKSGGGMLKDFRTAGARGEINEIGRYMLDNNMVRPLSSVDDIAEKAEAMRMSAGDKLDVVYGKASEKFGSGVGRIGFDPRRDKQALVAAARAELGDSVGAEAAIQKLSNYIDEVAARHGDKPAEIAQQAFKKEIEAYVPKFRQFLRDSREYKGALGQAGADANQPALSGMVDDLQRTSMSPQQVEIRGQAPSVMRPAHADPLMNQPYLPDMPTGNSEAQRLYGRPGDANFGDLGGDAADRIGRNVTDTLAGPAQRDFLDQNTTEQMSMFGQQGEIVGTEMVPRQYATANRPIIESQFGQTKMPFAPEPPTRPTRPPDVRNPMSPRRTNDIKGALDDQINYSRNPFAKEPATEVAFSAARQQLSKNIDEAIESLGGDELLAELKSANKEYGISKQLERISKDRVARDNANQALSLTDKIASGAGTVAGTVAGGGVGGIATGAATGALSKLTRKYGTTTLAYTADRISKRLLRTRQMQEIAATKPEVYKAVVLNMTRKVLERAEPLDAVAGPGELDRDSATPATEKAMPDGAMNEANAPSAANIAELVKSQPQAFGKFAQVLQNAESRGPQGVAATHFMLQQQNEEYRQMLREQAGLNT